MEEKWTLVHVLKQFIRPDGSLHIESPSLVQNIINVAETNEEMIKLGREAIFMRKQQTGSKPSEDTPGSGESS